MRTHRPFLAVVALTAVAAILAGCGSSKSTSNLSGQPSGTANAALHNMLPAAIKASGVVRVGSDASYPPIESIQPGTASTIVGLDPDIGHALGAVLGVQFKFVNQAFPGLIAAMQARRYDVAMSAMTDNKDREATLSFVDYFLAGASLAVKKGNPLGIRSLADLCGKSVSVEAATFEADDLKAQSKKCTSSGKSALNLLIFPDQNGAYLALRSGRAVAVLADTPVNTYTAALSGGLFQVAPGSNYGNAPYGIGVLKANTQLLKAIQAALKVIIANGTYARILAKWGLSDETLTTALINQPSNI